jgi:transcriptional regulator with XRE-family HTH domain
MNFVVLSDTLRYTDKEKGGRMVTLGERILVLRHRRKWTQARLAEMTGIAKNTIARLERGEIKDPGSEAIIKLAHAFHVSADVILGIVELHESEAEAPVAV